MPVLAFILPTGDAMAARTVQSTGAERYARLSPFDPQAREYIAEIYEDLARHATFAGCCSMTTPYWPIASAIGGPTS